MKKVICFFKKEIMLTAALVAAVASLFITPPSIALLGDIDWHTLATLFMMLTVLEGFKKENIFRPIIRLTARIRSMTALSFFLVFSVFFSSMFVTNDVSLIIFVPLTIMLFRAGGKEKYILPVITMENIAAIRGSLLTPFGSPQNLFLYSRSGLSAIRFMEIMLPLWLMSAALLSLFILFLFRRDLKEPVRFDDEKVCEKWDRAARVKRIVWLALFVLILWTIISRTQYWMWVALAVAVAVLITDRNILIKTDYVLLLTFFCFFVFSSSLSSNSSISAFLQSAVAGREYLWGILLSQGISNVPAAIVLYPFTQNLRALLYGVDTAGLCSIIGSLASVINYRIYVREYPENGGKFMKVFMIVSLAFFIIVVLPGYFISLRGI